MDWIVSSTVLLRGPMCILILFMGERIGLKLWLHISAILAILGNKMISIDAKSNICVSLNIICTMCLRRKFKSIKSNILTF